MPYVYNSNNIKQFGISKEQMTFSEEELDLIKGIIPSKAEDPDISITRKNKNGEVLLNMHTCDILLDEIKKIEPKTTEEKNVLNNLAEKVSTVKGNIKRSRIGLGAGAGVGILVAGVGVIPGAIIGALIARHQNKKARKEAIKNAKLS